MSPRALIAISFVALAPVWIYALLVHGGLYVAIVSSVSVALVVAALYTMFGPHEGDSAMDATDAKSA